MCMTAIKAEDNTVKMGLKISGTINLLAEKEESDSLKEALELMAAGFSEYFMSC